MSTKQQERFSSAYAMQKGGIYHLPSPATPVTYTKVDTATVSYSVAPVIFAAKNFHDGILT